MVKIYTCTYLTATGTFETRINASYLQMKKHISCLTPRE